MVSINVVVVFFIIFLFYHSTLTCIIQFILQGISHRHDLSAQKVGGLILYELREGIISYEILLCRCKITFSCFFLSVG